MPRDCTRSDRETETVHFGPKRASRLNMEMVKAAMGGASQRDAYFLRLFARGMEELRGPENVAMACATWDEFRQQAVREGWFTANGPEAATLCLHMAGVL